MIRLGAVEAVERLRAMERDLDSRRNRLSIPDDDEWHPLRLVVRGGTHVDAWLEIDGKKADCVTAFDFHVGAAGVATAVISVDLLDADISLPECKFVAVTKASPADPDEEN